MRARPSILGSPTLNGAGVAHAARAYTRCGDGAPRAAEGVVAAEVFDGDSLFDVTGWVALGFATLALVLGVAGVSAVRDRGEPVVAIIALVLVLALATFASALFLFGFGLGGFD